MASKTISFSLATLAIVMLTGCGGGGTSQSASSLSRETARLHTLAAARTTRNKTAFASLSYLIGQAVINRTRSATSSRAAVTGQDAPTQLYYTLTTNVDGSGKSDLFTDAAHAVVAGSVSWGVPVWANGTPDTYPAVLHVTFDIKAGSYKGDRGTADVTLKDASRTHLLIHTVVQDSQGDTETGDLAIDVDTETGTAQGTLGDGSHFDATLGFGVSGEMASDIHFQDGSKARVVVHPDGSETVTETGQNGKADATENNQSDGHGNINFQDGSQGDNVNVNE
jgi:hypothetical protein